MNKHFYLSMQKTLLPSRSTWIHLRFLYSLYLLPVFLFALSQSPIWNVMDMIMVFLVLHLFIYPASNGYNSYFDKDETSIGGVKIPPKVDISLLYASWFLDIFGTLWAFWIRWEFGLGVLIYGIFSKLYSNPKTRLKSRPIISFLIVFFFQGAFIFCISLLALTKISFLDLFSRETLLEALFASCIIGAMYIMTQVYQHKEDQMRGDITLSALLGYRGTFIFSGICFGLALGILVFLTSGRTLFVFSFLAFTFPLVVFFLYWFFRVWKSTDQANFSNTMRMSTLSFLCLSAYFIYLIWLHKVW